MPTMSACISEVRYGFSSQLSDAFETRRLVQRNLHQLPCGAAMSGTDGHSSLVLHTAAIAGHNHAEGLVQSPLQIGIILLAWHIRHDSWLDFTACRLV